MTNYPLPLKFLFGLLLLLPEMFILPSVMTGFGLFLSFSLLFRRWHTLWALHDATAVWCARSVWLRGFFG